MTQTIPALSADRIPEILAREAETGSVRHREGEALRAWIERLMARREVFGITRIGSLTRLDRVGVPVVQATRPLALSNAVSQGKGLDMVSATASALMETVETWAAERVPASSIHVSAAAAKGADMVDLYDPWIAGKAPVDWPSLDIPWIRGWDLLSGRPHPAPLALVDTDYRYPSAHAPLFPRVTTGLGAGASMSAAIVQAGREILERDALVRAQRTPFFFERFQLDLASLPSGPAASLIARVREAGLLIGAWRTPTDHALPVYRCHVMEAEWPLELAPMPAEGSACHVDDEGALVSALLEACQARLAAIAGTREDITRRMYPSAHDRAHLSEWRDQLRAGGTLPYAPECAADVHITWNTVLNALVQAGARAVIVVPLFSDPENAVHAVRVVAPPLRLWPGGGHG